jgi:hypothetical protein
MSDPEPLIYHQATFDLVGRQPVRRPDAEAVLARCEQALGFPLPAAVREWYSLQDALSLIEKYSNCDHPIDLDEAVEMRRIFEWDGDEGISLEQKLPIIWENEGVALCAVQLDGSVDPPVVVWDDERDWQPFADQFSDFIYRWIEFYL